MFRIRLDGELSMDKSKGYHSRTLECAEMKGELFATLPQGSTLLHMVSLSGSIGHYWNA